MAFARRNGQEAILIGRPSRRAYCAGTGASRPDSLSLDENRIVEVIDDAPRREPLEGLEKVHAKFGHLREQKRQREAVERARANVADRDER